MKTTAKSITLHLRIEPELVAIIDDWRRAQQDVPTRGEAVRRMVRIAAGKKVRK